MERKILHIDMDSFYASIESKRRGLEGQPVVVCVYSGRTENSGAVSTCSYEARDLGIHAAMPIVQAKRIAQNSDQEVHFVSMDKQYYRQISNNIRAQVLENYTDTIEQASIDEAYLDLTEEAETFEDAETIGRTIQEEIAENFDLTCSIGIGPNKLISKIASDRRKPEGLVCVKPEEVETFLNSLDLEEIHGIGEKTVETLNKIGIDTVEKLANADTRRLIDEFGETQGVKLSKKANGKDDSKVKEDNQKQVTRITTLDQNSHSFRYVRDYLPDLAQDVVNRMKEKDLYFRRAVLIVINSDIEMYTRSKSLNTPVQDKEILREEIEKLLERFMSEHDIRIRRVGVRASDLVVRKDQKSLEGF